MKKIKKGYKRVLVSIIFNSPTYGDFSPSDTYGKGIWFDIPEDMECEPIHLYQYESKKLGEETLKRQGVVRTDKYD